MTQFLKIAIELAAMTGPTYILIAGGIATGKSHVIKEYLPGILVMDIDDYMERLGFSDYNFHGTEYSVALRQITEDIKRLLDTKETFVSMGTAADTKFTIDKLAGAKIAGFTTIVLHITCPLEQAISQNNFRRLAGKRAVSDTDLHLLEQTKRKSAETVSCLRDTILMDYLVEYDNTRN